MFGPLNDIGSVSGLLGTALKQYLALCSTLDPRAYPIPKSLSHLIENELLALDSFETMIRQAKSALGHAKNSSPAIVPINSLPSEILSHIFFLVPDTPCPGFDQDGNMSSRFPKYPDIFLHVCSRWRQVATSSCKLWSHIDIIPRYVSTTGLLTRAETLVALAGQSPLELHISGTDESGTDPDYPSDTNTRLFQLLSSVAPQLQSFELVVHSFTDFYLSIIEACFVKCTPGMLTRLVIQRPSDSYLNPNSESNLGFIEATENASGRDAVLVNTPKEDLEALWAPIKTLSLCGVYPHWSSQAYHGLVELLLPALFTRPDLIITITEAQLVGVLRSSPQLRVLNLGINVEEPLPENAPITPVYLNSLEVLDLSSSIFGQNGTILRWIVSGPNPPIVALKCLSWDEDLPDDETKKFLARSRTTKLAVSGPDSNDWPPSLLSLSPHLQTLVFRGLGYYASATREPARFPEEHSLPLDFRPNYLHIIFCGSIIDFRWLRRVLERRPIQSITLWSSEPRRHSEIVPNDEVKFELLQVCPGVRIMGFNEPDPIEGWGLLD